VESAEDEFCHNDVEEYPEMRQAVQRPDTESLQRMSSVTMMMKIIFLSCPETGCSETRYRDSGICRG